MSSSWFSVLCVVCLMVWPIRLSGQHPASGLIDSRAFITLNTAVAALDPLDSTRAGNDEAINQRFALSGQALDAMTASVHNVNQVLGFAAFEQAFGASSNPWADESFRNIFDQASNWSSSLGLLAAAIGSYADEDNRETWLQLGIGVGGLGKVLGTLLGQQTGEKFESKAGFVEYTRQAYEDLRGRYATANEYIESNAAFIADLGRFRENELAKAVTSEDKRRVITTAGSYLTRFDLIMTQIPAMLQLYEQTINRYCPQAIPQAQADPQNVGAVTCSTHAAGDRRAISLEGDAKKYMLQAAVQLERLKSNLAEANRVRELSAPLRGALVGS